MSAIPVQVQGPIRQVRWAGSDCIVHAAGDIDLSSSQHFQQGLLAIVDRRPARLIINLADVPYMDSAGVASLVKVLSRLRRLNASLHLVCLRQRVRSIFEITHLDGVFDIRRSEQEVAV